MTTPHSMNTGLAKSLFISLAAIATIAILMQIPGQVYRRRYTAWRAASQLTLGMFNIVPFVTAF